MMLKNIFSHIFVCVLAVFTTAAMATAGGQLRETPMNVSVLASGWQCLKAPAGWSAAWISSPEELQAMMTKCRSTSLGADSSDLPSVDFDRFGVLAVEMGRKSSAGYEFDTQNISAQTVGDTATITLPHVQPPPGAITAQVMTAPWILITFPAEGFHNIRVVDQEGALLAQIERP